MDLTPFYGPLFVPEWKVLVVTDPVCHGRVRCLQVCQDRLNTGECDMAKHSKRLSKLPLFLWPEECVLKGESPLKGSQALHAGPLATLGDVPRKEVWLI